MNNRVNNLFHNVIKNETSLTEFFCNLMRYKAFRDLFLNIVKTKNNAFNVSNVSYEDFDTEVKLKDNQGRSDLHLTTNDTEYIFEIKIELYTGLTANQPNGYLDYLAKNKNVEDKNKNRNLFFILPRAYLHLGDLYQKWQAYSKYK